MVQQVLGHYDLPDMRLYKVAVTPDSVRFIGVGPLLRSKDNLQPSKSRGEKRIIGADQCQPVTTLADFLHQYIIWKQRK